MGSVPSPMINPLIWRHGWRSAASCSSRGISLFPASLFVLPMTGLLFLYVTARFTAIRRFFQSMSSHRSAITSPRRIPVKIRSARRSPSSRFRLGIPRMIPFSSKSSKALRFSSLSDEMNRRLLSMGFRFMNSSSTARSKT